MRCTSLLPLALFVFSGCAVDTFELYVDVRTDLAPGVAFDQVTTELYADESRPPVRSSTTSAGPSDDFSTGRRVADFADVADGAYTLRVTLLADGTSTQSQRLLIQVHTDRAVTLTFDAVCSGVVCPGPGDPMTASECSAGRCIEPQSSCESAMDCPAQDCAIASCNAGVCTYEDACDGGTDAALDADAGDASTPDAGDSGPRPADSGVDSGVPPADSGVTDAAMPAAPNIVFVTSTAQAAGSLGGLAGADALCQTLADAAILPGTYRAWLSSSTVNAADRLAGARGWERVDGLPFVDTVADLVAGRIYYPVRLDESGSDVIGAFTPPQVVTGTGADGIAGDTCADWTSSSGLVHYGSPHATTRSWTEGAFTGCSNATRLYCFGVDEDVAVAPAPVTGRRAFVSADYWQPDDGLAAADAQCAADASAAGYGGTFRAFLTPSGASAASRFGGGANWIRPDGVAIASSAAAFLGGEALTSINVTAAGDYISSGSVWSGSPRTWGTGTATTTCEDWTSALGTATGHYGLVNRSGLEFFDSRSRACDWSFSYIYCLEL